MTFVLENAGAYYKYKLKNRSSYEDFPKIH
jgi:hypothetical protein